MSSRPDRPTLTPAERPIHRTGSGGGSGRCCKLVLFNVTNGLIIGAFYVLMALGPVADPQSRNVINFAHGNFLALGGYLAFMLTPLLGLGRACWSRRCSRR